MIREQVVSIKETMNNIYFWIFGLTDRLFECLPGYTSTAAKGLQEGLAAKNSQGFSIHSRVLGNVLYLMASMRSTPENLREIEALVRGCLQEKEN